MVAALGGNALLRRGERPGAEIQRHHVVRAVEALVPVARSHDLVVTHGNGPQVGMLAMESARDPDVGRPYPFDVLGAQTQGMIGYWLCQALRNALPGRPVAGLVTQTVVAGDDPAFGAPAKFVGPDYPEDRARALARRWGWRIGRDGDAWRRVVASPEPLEVVESAQVDALVSTGSVVVCAGGGGVPTVRGARGELHGVEAVVDKDLTSALLARSLGADALLLLTDVPAVSIGFGSPDARPLRTTTPSELRRHSFPAGSMGPKVEAACRFAAAGGRTAAIGHMDDAAGLLAGTSGTVVRVPVAGEVRVDDDTGGAGGRAGGGRARSPATLGALGGAA